MTVKSSIVEVPFDSCEIEVEKFQKALDEGVKLESTPSVPGVKQMH